jgi:DNA-binding transcriptional ArsR family regulator
MNISVMAMHKNAEQAAEWLKTIAHPDRLFILCQLVDSELCVGDLLKNSRLSQSAFSQHLALLRNKEMVKTRKESQTVYYSLADDHVAELIETLHNVFCN